MTRKRGYQRHLSHGDMVLKDVEGRSQKFEKILCVLKDFHPSIESLNCLDIGCSSGIITSLLGKHFTIAIGIDIDQEAIHYAKTKNVSTKSQFLIADAISLPFKDGVFDAIICNHIYEHVPDARGMIDEIHRIMKEKGFCYFSAGNKLMIMEGHYHLPFLSWLPKPIAHIYLRLIRKGNFYYEEHLSLRGLKRLVQKFYIHDYTLAIIRDPVKFFATDLLKPEGFFYKWIRLLAPYLYSLIPTYVWILTKK